MIDSRLAPLSVPPQCVGEGTKQMITDGPLIWNLAQFTPPPFFFCTDQATQEDRAANTLQPSHIKSAAFRLSLPG